MCLRSLGFALLSLTAIHGCSGAEAPDKAIAKTQAQKELTPPSPQGPEAADEAKVGDGVAGGQLSAEELAEAEAMCAAIDHDYVDGTLTDYFKNVKSKTPWGQAVQKKADESTTPGRVMLAELKAKGVAGDDKRVPACARIYDYIDDVE